MLFDTSIYITASHMGLDAALGLRRIAAGAPMWLSSVALEELYAGVNARNRHVIERLERDFHRAGRVLVPNLADWTRTGKVLALLAAKYDEEQIGKGRLTNDTMIAMSTGRLGVTVLTANARDFKKLAAFRPFQWRIERLGMDEDSSVEVHWTNALEHRAMRFPNGLRTATFGGWLMPKICAHQKMVRRRVHARYGLDR